MCIRDRLDEVVRRCGIARDDDGPIAPIEPIAERGDDGGMMYECSSDLDIVVFHDEAALAQLVDVNQWNERNSSLVSDARIDVVRVHLEEQLRHLRERRWAPSVYAGPKPRGPRERKQVSVVGIVIRVMMRE